MITCLSRVNVLTFFLFFVDDNEVVTPTSPVKSEPALPPLSESDPKSKRERRNENESRVYNLATDKLIKNLMTEYKKRKNQNAMPNFTKVTKKEEKKMKKKATNSDPQEQAIEQQQQTSIMKVSGLKSCVPCIRL